ncbi:hypothetical protein GCM10025794_00680 [Massilia kyonggiensis]|nr:hypothetical protein [Massilia kyonggiensis]
MSLAVLRSRALAGMEAPAVSVEVHLANGLPAMNIVESKPPFASIASDRLRRPRSPQFTSANIA